MVFFPMVLYKFPSSKFCHGNQTKRPLVIKHIHWVDNYQMIITSHHFNGYGENAILPCFHYKSMGAFCRHDNQTNRQITIILAIFNHQPHPPLPTPHTHTPPPRPPTQHLYLIGTNCFNGFGGGRLKVLTDRQMDGRRTKSDHYSSS